jgi:hypothetical protein
MSRRKYKEYPKGCGQMTAGNKEGNIVDFELLIANGNRAQRRFALCEIKKLRKSRGY